jgi:hypothetical protein
MYIAGFSCAARFVLLRAYLYFLHRMRDDEGDYPLQDYLIEASHHGS